MFTNQTHKKKDQKKEDHYQFITDNSVDVIWQLDLRLRFTYVSPSIFPMTGFTPEEWVGTSLSQHSTTREFFQMARKALKAFKDYRNFDHIVFEAKMLKKNQQEFPVEISSKLLFNERGIPIGLQGSTRDITERKQLEQELLQRNVYLEALQKTTEDLLSQLELDTLLEKIVQRASQLMGTDSGFLDLVDENAGKFVPKVGVGAFAESLHWHVVLSDGVAGKVWQTGQTVVVNNYDSWPDRITSVGEGKLAALICTPLQSGGQMLGVLGVAHKSGNQKNFEEGDVDILTQFARLCVIAIENARLFSEAQREIADRKRSELELRESEQRFRLTFEQAAVGIAHVTPQGRFIRINQRFCDIVGYSREEMLARTFQEISHPDELEADLKLIEQLLSGEIKTLSLEKRYFRRDGSIVWVKLTESLARDPSGEPQYLISIIEDIIGRKRIEAELKESETRFRRLAENAQDLIYRFDLLPEPHFSFVSPAAVAVTGYTPEEHYADPDLGYKIVHSDDRSMLEMVARGEITNPLVLRWVHKDGNVIWIEQRNVPILDSDGKLIALEGIARDITERKLAELELKQQSEELQRSNAELEQFAYVASHDLQEPLRMVANYLQLIQRRYKGKLDQDADEFIHFAVDGAERMHKLIDNLLEYSRVGTRGKELVPCSSEDALQLAIRNVQTSIAAAHAEITHDPLPDVIADFGQLVQLFQNLISNAVKFRSKETPKVHIGVEEHIDPEKGKMWQLSVKDNGIGIDPQFADKVFVIFQRANTRDEYPGSGIGLAICKKIVVRHGGRIWFESQSGEGTTFYFTLKSVD